MSKKHDIESLFNSKLSGLEHTPSPEVWEKTARTLRRRSFLRFNARRFNIYYIIASVIIIGGIEISSLISKLDNTNPQPSSLHPLPSTLNAPPSINEDSILEVKTQRSTQNQNSTSSPGTVQNAQRKAQTTDKETETSKLHPTTSKQGTKTKNQSPNTVNTPIVYFTPSTFEGCAPLSITLINSSMHVSDLTWYCNDQEISFTVASTKGSSCSFEEPGEYTITLKAKDDNNILYTHTELITVHPSPTAEFEIADGEIYNYSLNASNYEWNLLTPRTGQPALRTTISETFTCQYPNYSDSASLQLICINEFTCSDTLVRSLPKISQPHMEFPSAFSPNKNGPTGGYYNSLVPDNSIFYPTHKEKPATYKLSIYNKAGELIFETSEIETGWDGYHKEALSPQGVYIYNCTGTWNNGDAFNYRGDITLLLDW